VKLVVFGVPGDPA